jgi:hypothetical protein
MWCQRVVVFEPAAELREHRLRIAQLRVPEIVTFERPHKSFGQEHVALNCSPSANKMTNGIQVAFGFIPTQPTTTYTLGFAAWNTLDNLAPSAMFIDDVQIRAIPWGANLTLVALGALLLVVLTARARP